MTGSLLLLFAIPARADGRWNFRYDLLAKLPTFCAHPELNGSNFLKLGVLDSQVLALLFPRTMSVESLSERKGKGFNGEAHLNCDADHSLLLLTRSPVPLQTDKKSLSIPHEVSNLCQSLSARFVKASNGSSEELSVASQIVVPQSDGIISITCVPKDDPQAGNQTWFWIATGRGPQDSVPFSELLKSEAFPDLAIQSWLNAVRKAENKSALDYASAKLRSIVTRLADRRAIEHDRTLNSSLQKSAHDHGLALIGEDRAQAPTLKELAWLLWNSPSHRDLLLNDEASLSSLAISRKDRNWFIVLLLASKHENSGS